MSETYVNDRSDSRNLENKIHQPPEPFDEKDLEEQRIFQQGTKFEENIDDDVLVEELFAKKPWIVRALNEAGISYASQIPRDEDDILKIKGIGKKSLIDIMEVI